MRLSMRRKPLMAGRILTGTLTGFLLGALLVVSSGLQAVPDSEVVYGACFDPSDRDRRLTERGICDGIAEATGFRVGVLRQLNPSDGEEPPLLCEEVDDVAHLCEAHAPILY